MTQALPLDGPASAGPLRLVPGNCSLCGADEGEPVAVGNDFGQRTTADSFLVLSCRRCGLLYLNPRPASEEGIRLYPPGYFESPLRRRAFGTDRRAVRELVRACGAMPPGARVLEVAYGPTLHIGHLRGWGSTGWGLEVLTPHERLARSAEEAGLVVHRGRARTLAEIGAVYDVILLLHGLEHCDAPLEELGSLRSLLRVNGRLVIVTPNAASAAWHLFQGRHWAGYDFPRHRCLFGPDTLRILAAESDFAVEWLGSRGDPEVWARSAGNFARDWCAPAWLARAAVSGFSVLGALEAMTYRRGSAVARGAQLQAILRKPTEVRG